MADLRIPDWAPELSVGHPQPDAQHRQLISLGQQALELLDVPQADSGRFHQLLNDIADVMRRHFVAEEAVLQAKHCPALAEHRARHDQYLERLTELLYNGANGETDKVGLARLIHALVAGHVLEDDLPLKTYLQRTGRR
ncbi:MAG: hypothetical protein RJA36_2865 [Pseudomonadota bacterium]|jgi:hemerythrin-like metal-binding protein